MLRGQTAVGAPHVQRQIWFQARALLPYGLVSLPLGLVQEIPRSALGGLLGYKSQRELIRIFARERIICVVDQLFLLRGKRARGESGDAGDSLWFSFLNPLDTLVASSLDPLGGAVSGVLDRLAAAPHFSANLCQNSSVCIVERPRLDALL